MEHKIHKQFDTDCRVKLASYELSVLFSEKCPKHYSHECFVMGSEHTGLEYISDEYSGLIPEGFQFLCYRPTLEYIQTHLRENGIVVLVYLNKNLKYLNKINDLINQTEVKSSIGNDDYYLELEAGLLYGLNKLI